MGYCRIVQEDVDVSEFRFNLRRDHALYVS
jgi:hypothetical protein